MAFFSKRRVLLILLGAVVAMVLVRSLMTLFINSFEEKALSEEFIKANPEVVAEFGSVELKAVSMHVSYSSEGDSGDFGFKVRGTKRNGRIMITWERAGAGAKFYPKEIVELRPFAPKKRLWPKGLENGQEGKGQPRREWRLV